MLQLVNLNESFIHYYAHHADYLMRFTKNSVKPYGFRGIQKGAKNQNLELNSTWTGGEIR